MSPAAMIGPGRVVISPASAVGFTCIPNTASTSSSAPSFTIRSPPDRFSSSRFSSLGWNSNLIEPGKRPSSAKLLSTVAAPISIAVWQSWPQACIRPGIWLSNSVPFSSWMGSASISALRPTVGPLFCPTIRPITPVLATPVSASIPKSFKTDWTKRAVLTSVKLSSGCIWMVRRQSTISVSMPFARAIISSGVIGF